MSGTRLAALFTPLRDFHRAGATEEADTVTSWSSAQTLTASGHALASFDYKPVRAVASSERSNIDQGTAGADLAASLEHYGAQSQYYAANADEGNRYTRLRAEAAELSARTFEGVGTCRELASEREEDTRFTI